MTTITDVEAIVLRNPNIDPSACDSAQDAVLVRIRTDGGVVGIGEVDATPQAIKAFIEAEPSHAYSLGIRELLLGEDPTDVRRLWHKLYRGTMMAGRRGLGVHAIGAIDVALWDLRGKIEGKPVWKLLGGALQPYVTPYASILPKGQLGPGVFEDTTQQMLQARDSGFRAAKIEPVVEVTRNEGDVIEISQHAREALGSDVILMIDVGYRWPTAKAALPTLRTLEELDPFFVETPIEIDRNAAYAELAAATPLRIAAGELNATRFEFVELMQHAKVDVIQPDVPRAGGITESLRIAEAAEDLGRIVVPHAWNTGITTAAAIHLAAVSANCPFVEYLPPSLVDNGLRRDLLAKEPRMVDGVIRLPTDPGLSIELDEAAVEHYQTTGLRAVA